MMAGDDKKTKAAPAPKKEAAAADKSATVAAPAKAADAAPAKTADVAPAKPEGGDAAAVPTNYSRGEGQKPVTQAYKDNWNAIFAKKTKKKTKKKKR